MINKKKVVSFSLATAMVASMGMSSFAAPDAYVLESDGEYFQYDVDQLSDSYIELIDTALYEDFNSKLATGASFYSFRDDVTGQYVDYDSIVTEFTADPESFNLNEYTEAVDAPVPADLPEQVSQVNMAADGTISTEDVDTGEVATDLTFEVGATIAQDATGYYIPVTFSAALDADADYSEILESVGEAGEHLTVDGDSTLANIDVAELDATNPAVLNLRMSDASVAAIPDGAELGFAFSSGAITDAEGNVLADADLEATVTVANPFASGDVVISAAAATTDETSKLTTFTAVVANAEEGATATITITPDASLGADAIVVEDVAITDGAISYENATELPAGTHSFTVTVGEVVSDAAEFTVEETVVEELTVESVSAINGTSITVTGTGFTAENIDDLTTGLVLANTDTPTTKYAVSNPVLVSATEVTMTVVTVGPGVDVTWTYGEATGTFTGESVVPTIESVEAMSSKQIKVMFSEAMANATTVTNYSIYSADGGNLYAFGNVGDGGGTVEVTAALSSDKKEVIFTIVEDNGNAGFLNDGLLSGNYILYTNDAALTSTSVKDLAGNYVVKNTANQFQGVITADSEAPALISATYDTGLKQLTLGFDEAPTVADITKYSVVNGETTVALTASDSSTVTGLEVTITLSDDHATAVGDLVDGAYVAIAAGGVKDAQDNVNAEELTNTLTSVIRPAVTGVAYDEDALKLTMTFSEAIKLNSLTDLSKFKVQYSTNGGSTWTDLMTTSQFAANMAVATTGTTSNTVEFTANATGAGLLAAQRDTSNVTYRAVVTDSAFVDADDNANDTGAAGGSDTANVSMTYTKEEVAPYVTKAEYTTSDDTLTVYFSEKVVVPAADANVWDNVDLTYDNAGVETDITGLESLDEDGANITTGPTLATGDTKMTVVLAGGGNTALLAKRTNSPKVQMNDGTTITDVNGNAIELGSVDITVIDDDAVTNLTATQLSSKQFKVVAAGNTFDEATVEDINKFNLYVTGNPNATVDLKSVDLIDVDNDGVKETLYVTIVDTDNLKVDGVVAGYYTLEYTGLKDKAGVAIDDDSITMASLGADDGSAPSVVASGTKITNDADGSSSVTANDIVTLYFDEPVVVPNASDLEAAFGSSATVAQGSDSNILEVTLGSSPTLTLGSSGTSLGANGIEDIVGNAYAGGDNVDYPSSSAAPSVDTDDEGDALITFADVDANGTISDGDTMTITFDRDLDPDATITLSKFITESADDSELFASNDGATGDSFDDATISGRDLTLTFAAGLDDTTGAGGTAYAAFADDAFEVDILAASGIADKWGNVSAAMEDNAFVRPSSAVKLTDIAYDATLDTNKGGLILTFDAPVAITGTNDDFAADLNAILGAGSTLAATAGKDAANAAYYVDDESKTHYNKVVVLLDGTQAIDENTTFDAEAGAIFSTATVTDVYSRGAARNTATYTLTVE